MRRATLIAALVAALTTAARTDSAQLQPIPAQVSAALSGQAPATATPSASSDAGSQAAVTETGGPSAGRFHQPPPDFLKFFPFFFIGGWFLITSILSVMSGWLGLMRRYPDRPEPALAKLGFMSGRMGEGVNMGSILTLTACPSGLRVAIWRIFGPFCRPFFVPWREITAEPITYFLSPMVRLRFGNPQAGVLTIHARPWERLSDAARRESGAQVPPAQPVSEMSLARAAVVQWGAVTALAGAFFYFAPRLLAPGAPYPPLAICIGFPAAVFGFGQLVQYLRHRGAG